MYCASCRCKIQEDQLRCPNCGFVFPRHTGDKDSYEKMLVEIGEEYRKANNISTWKKTVKKEIKTEVVKTQKKVVPKTAVNKKNNASVENVRKLIKDIGFVSMYSGGKIVSARQAYDALNAKDKAEISKAEVNVLVKAETDYQTLKINMLEATQAERRIKDIGPVTVESKAKIALARTTYDGLPSEAKKAVTDQNLQILKDAELSYNKLVQEKEEKIEDVIRRIKSLNEVMYPSREKILQARKSFDSLTEEEKSRIPSTTRQILMEDEKKIKQVETNIGLDKKAANIVEREINSIGTVSIAQKSNVLHARMSYNALSNAQKKWVSSSAETSLKTAENMLKQLEDKDIASRVEHEINAIGTVTIAQKSKVLRARMSYDLLSGSQKRMMSASAENILKTAEKTLKQLEDREKQKKQDDTNKSLKKVEEVVNRVRNLQEVGNPSKESINATLKAWDELTEAEKNLLPFAMKKAVIEIVNNNRAKENEVNKAKKYEYVVSKSNVSSTNEKDKKKDVSEQTNSKVSEQIGNNISFYILSFAIWMFGVVGCMISPNAGFHSGDILHYASNLREPIYAIYNSASGSSILRELFTIGICIPSLLIWIFSLIRIVKYRKTDSKIILWTFVLSLIVMYIANMAYCYVIFKNPLLYIDILKKYGVIATFTTNY